VGDVPAGFKGDEHKLTIVTPTLSVRYIEATCAEERPPTAQIDWGRYILQQAGVEVGEVLVDLPPPASGLTSVEHWALHEAYQPPGSPGGAYTVTHVPPGYRPETSEARPGMGGAARARPQIKAGSQKASVGRGTVFIVAHCLEK
jgi:hypothetical protein